MDKKKVSKSTKGIPVFTILLSCCILAGLILIYAIYLNVTAYTHGNEMGKRIGSLAGKAVGSFAGMTEGREQGFADGKAAGLSAEDTVAEIANGLHQINHLEVLVASVKASNIHTIGDDDYKAIYLLKGNAVFTVDLSKAVIDLKDNELKVLLPLPEGKLFIDQSKIEKIAEYQKHFFSGSAESGFEAYLNSLQNISEATAETLDNYDVLIEAAKESAKKQVQQLALSVRFNYYPVSVDIKE